MEIKKIFNEPKIVGIVADPNSGKSNLFYHLIEELKKAGSFNLVTYGLLNDVGGQKIYSIEELERVRDSVVFVDEFYTLFDLEDRKKVKIIEKTFRLIFHNNNILVLGGVPENFRKFISNKLNTIFFGKCSIGDFINGSRVKSLCLNYNGNELGSSVLNLTEDSFIVYDGHYEKVKVPYLTTMDTKKGNKPILVEKIVNEKLSGENVPIEVIETPEYYDEFPDFPTPVEDYNDYSL